MQMKHFLTCNFAVRQEEVDSFASQPGRPQSVSNLLADTEKLSTVVGVEIHQRGSVRSGYDQRVPWIHRSNIQEGVTQFILV